MRWIVTALLSALALAGCADDGGEQTSAAAVGFDGSGSVDETDVARCDDGRAQLTGAGSLEDGQVTVVILDGQGQEVLRESFDDRIDVEAEALEGASGQWTVRADGSDAMDGVYTFNLVCT